MWRRLAVIPLLHAPLATISMFGRLLVHNICVISPGLGNIAVQRQRPRPVGTQQRSLVPMVSSNLLFAKAF